jgi:hypothetical protein
METMHQLCLIRAASSFPLLVASMSRSPPGILSVSRARPATLPRRNRCGRLAAR